MSLVLLLIRALSFSWYNKQQQMNLKIKSKLEKNGFKNVNKKLLVIRFKKNLKAVFSFAIIFKFSSFSVDFMLRKNFSFFFLRSTM